MKVGLSLLVFALFQNIGAYDFSCEEIRDNLINKEFYDFSENMFYATVIVQEGFTNRDQLDKIRIKKGEYSEPLSFLANPLWYYNTETSSRWKIVADEDLALNCTQEFNLIFASQKNVVPATPETKVDDLTVSPDSSSHGMTNVYTRIFAVPRGGMWIRITKMNCTENSHKSLWISEGTGITLYRKPRFWKNWSKSLQSWACSNLPQVLVTFDSVITLYSTEANYTLEYSSDLESLQVAPGDRIVLFASDNWPSLDKMRTARARFQIGEKDHNISVDIDMEYAPNTTYVDLIRNTKGDQKRYFTGLGAENFISNFFEVHYNPGMISPVWGNTNVFIRININISSEEITKNEDETTPAIFHTSSSTTLTMNCVVVVVASSFEFFLRF